MKRKPNSKILAKGNHSPPPPIHWNTRSEIMPPPRPRASKVREVVNKPMTHMERLSSAGTSKESIQRPLNKGDQNDRSRSPNRRSEVVGDRSSNQPSFFSTRSALTAKTKSRVATGPSYNNNYTSMCVRNVKGSCPINPPPPPVRMAAAAAGKKDTSVKSREAWNAANRYERLNNLCHALTVTPHNARVTPIASDRATAMYSTAASRGSVQSNPRRRLGRSPSPSPPPTMRVMGNTRATNTPSGSANASRRLPCKDGSKTSLKKTLSRLKCTKVACDGSIGGHSYGAGSLGARRQAPAPAVQRSPRVRSDERTIATQGDMLNCIKFQRRLRNNNEFDEKFNKKSSISKNTNTRPVPIPNSAGSSTFRSRY